MATDFWQVGQETWQILLLYFPLGVIGLWRWGVWLIKKTYAATYRPQLGIGTGSVAVVTPVYNENPVLFRQALESWRDNGVQEIVAVIDQSDTKCCSVFVDFAREFSGARLVVTDVPGKRPALVRGIQEAGTEFVALVDSDTVWGDHVKDYALVPFKNPKVGGVGTRQSVMEPRTLAQRLFNAQLNLRYLEEMPFMVADGGVVVTCLSGRTAFYRRKAVLPLLDQLRHETFWGRPVISGDDKRLTYLVEAAGWHVAFQQNAHVFTPGMATMGAFLKQRLRWTRNSWRADLRTLTQEWVWWHPRFVLYLLDRVCQPFAQLLSPIFFIVSLFLGLWVHAAILFVWWHIGRTIRLWPYLRRYPREVHLIPFFVLLNFYSALMKIYALATMNRQGWITRWDKARLPRTPTWLRQVPAYTMTGMMLTPLALGVTLHEQMVSQSWQDEQLAATRLLALDQAPERSVGVSEFTGGQTIERYIVQRGDTLRDLALRWQVSIEEIVRVNAVRLPSVDYFEAGLVLERPSPHHAVVKAAFASEYEQLGPLRITYVATTNTIEVRGRGQQVTPYDIARRVSPEQLRELAPGEWLLGANLAIKAGVMLTLQQPEVRWLKIKSNTEEKVHITIESGQLFVQQAKITSWDSEANHVDEEAEDGRSYIVAKGTSRFDIEGAELAYLGQPVPPEGPFGTTGVAWHLSDEERGTSIITGEIGGSRFHHNYDGIYVSGGVGLRIIGNQFYDNIRYGIDLYGHTHDSVVVDNEVHHNGTHGIILAASSTANNVRHNRVYDNIQHGILLHEQSSYNQVTDNEVYRHRDGIVLHRTTNSLVTNNNIHNNDRGIRLTQSTYNLLADNQIRDNLRHGVYLGQQSADNVLRSNLVQGSPVGLYVLSSNNTITGNSVRANTRGIALQSAAAANRLSKNTLQDAEAAIYIKTSAANYAGENIFINNQAEYMAPP